MATVARETNKGSMNPQVCLQGIDMEFRFR